MEKFRSRRHIAYIALYLIHLSWRLVIEYIHEPLLACRSGLQLLLLVFWLESLFIRVRSESG